MTLKKILSVCALFLIGANNINMYAGIIGYQSVYHPKVKTHVHLVCDMHMPYKGSQKNKKRSWLNRFHPGDREFYKILKNLDKNNKLSIDLIWEGHPDYPVNSRDPFILQAGNKLSKELSNINFIYSDTHRSKFAQALHEFLDVTHSTIHQDAQSCNIAIPTQENFNGPLDFIFKMTGKIFKAGRNVVANVVKPTFLSPIKNIFFKPTNKKIYKKIQKRYGSQSANIWKKEFQSNRNYWKKYYNHYMAKFESKDLKYFVQNGGIDGLVNVPYNSEICRSVKPFHEINPKRFDEYQKIFDIQALTNILMSNKKHIIVYCGAAHCNNLCMHLEKLGFQAERSKIDTGMFTGGKVKFINPSDLKFLNNLK